MWKASLPALLLLTTSGCGSYSERAAHTAAEELVSTAVHTTDSAQQLGLPLSLFLDY